MRGHSRMDIRSVAAAARRYLEAEKAVLDRLPLQDVARIAAHLAVAYEQGNRIFVFGNGGSGAAASHFACDINKGVSDGLSKRFRVLCLNDNIPIMLAYANDRSYADIFVEQLKNFIQPDDVVIAISGSGNSVNVVRAVEFANSVGARTIGLTGFDGGDLAHECDISLIVPSRDMQQVEDAHLIIIHIMMQVLSSHLHPDGVLVDPVLTTKQPR